MSINFNGKNINSIMLNGKKPSKVVYNGRDLLVPTYEYSFRADYKLKPNEQVTVKTYNLDGTETEEIKSEDFSLNVNYDVVAYFEILDGAYIDSVENIIGNPKCCTSMFKSLNDLSVDLILTDLDTTLAYDFSEMFSNFYSPNFTSLSLNLINASNLNKMFAQSEKLTTLDLSGCINTNKVKILTETFKDCLLLSEIDLTNWDTSSLINLKMTWMDCSNLETIIGINDLNVSSVIDMTETFSNTNFKTLDLSNWDTAKVVTFFGMFASCKLMDTLDIANFSYDSCEVIDYCLFNCESLTDIVVTNLTNVSQKIKTLNSTFEGCRSLNDFDFLHFDFTNVTSINKLLKGCTGIKEINLTGANLETIKTAQESFFGCINLTTINMSNCVTTSLTNISRIVGDCNSLEYIIADHWAIPINCRTKDVFVNCDNLKRPNLIEKTNIEQTDYVYRYIAGEVIIESNKFSATYEGSGSVSLTKFDSNWSLITTTEYLPFTLEIDYNDYQQFLISSDQENVTAITNIYGRPPNCTDMFSNFKNITTLDLTNLDFSICTNIDHMCSYCSSLTEIIFADDIDTSNIIKFDYAFSHCDSIISLDLSNWSTENAHTMTGMFSDMTTIKEIILGDWRNNNITKYNYMFRHCGELEYIKATLFTTNFNSVDIKYQMFDNDDSLIRPDSSEQQSLMSVAGFDYSYS